MQIRRDNTRLLREIITDKRKEMLPFYFKILMIIIYDSYSKYTHSHKLIIKRTIKIENITQKQQLVKKNLELNSLFFLLISLSVP